MDLRTFLDHLIRSSICTTEQLKRAVMLRRELDTRFGSLATLRGYLSAKDVLVVLARQVDRTERFGDLCVADGFFTEAQRDEIAALQKDDVGLLGECLVLAGVLTPEGVREARKGARAPSAPVPDVVLPLRKPSRRTPQEVRHALRKVGKLASLPDVVQRVLSMLDEPDCRLELVAKIIEADQMISTQMIRMVNSSMYGVRRKVASVSKALLLLGVRAVRQIVLSAVVADRFECLGGDRAQALWRHAIRTGRWARALAMKEGKLDPDEVFAAGIVHEFGIAVLHQYFPEDMLEVAVLVRRGAEELDAEREVLGLTHCEVGAFLSQLWTFSPSISQSVLHHHAPVSMLRTIRDLPPVAAWVHAGCRLAGAETDDPAWIESLGDEFLSYHRLTPEFLARTGPRVRQESEELSELLF